MAGQGAAAVAVLPGVEDAEADVDIGFVADIAAGGLAHGRRGHRDGGVGRLDVNRARAASADGGDVRVLVHVVDSDEADVAGRGRDDGVDRDIGGRVAASLIRGEEDVT